MDHPLMENRMDYLECLMNQIGKEVLIDMVNYL